jgi:hypothetical protein
VSAASPTGAVRVAPPSIRAVHALLAVGVGVVAAAVPKQSFHWSGLLYWPYLAVVVVLTVWASVRCWRMEFTGDDSGVTIRNVFRTHRMGWVDVKDIRGGSFAGGWSGIHVECSDGRIIKVTVTIDHTRDESVWTLSSLAASHGVAGNRQ